MVSVEIHIPSRSRGGHPIHAVHHLDFTVAVTEQVAPIARLHGVMLGVLGRGESIALDPLTVVYLIRFASIADLWQVAQVVALAKEYFAQDTIRVVCHETVEEM